MALFNFSFDDVNSVTGVFIKDNFAASPLTLGLLFVFVGIATAFVQGALIEPSDSRHGEKRMALVNLLGSVIGWPLIMLGPLWAGAVYNHVMPSSPYWMGAIILGFACLLLAQVTIKVQASRPVGVEPSAD